MNAAQLQVWKGARRAVIAVPVIAGLAAVGYFGSHYFAGMNQPQQHFVFYEVTKADLPIVVTERGSLESQVRTEIRCEVENISVDRSGNYGTQIIFIVPNGSAVKAGDLLVELDSAAIRERLDLQTLNVQRATSIRIQAQAKYENQKTQNETLEAEAKLKLELAKLQLKMYTDDENGEFKLAQDEIDRTIDEATNQILEAKAALELQKTERSGIQTLFELGYRGQSDLAQSIFKYLQAEDKLSAAMNRLETTQATRSQLTKYIKQMKELTLEGDVETANRNVQQVVTDNASKLQQAEAAKLEAENTEAKEIERLAKLQSQLEKCKILAPHDGMAVYARESRYSNDTEIAEGVTVRERQTILSLPDLSKMQIKTQIHEAVLDQIQAGLPVTVRVDAFPDRRYVGVVEDVAVVPTSNGWYGSSVKTYDCVVRIPDRVESLKPGMTAVVDIHVDRIRNIMAIPVQAVFQVDKDHWCYVNGPEGVEKRKLSIGRNNDKFVHIVDGLALSEQVILNPMSLFDANEATSGDISPDADSPDVPVLPVEKIADNKPAGDRVPAKAPPGGKGKRSRPPGGGKSKGSGAESPPTASAG
ncbi:MAG: efflux RND transporter periplasmic adaptor subunit [Pirellulaceae bacterium]